MEILNKYNDKNGEFYIEENGEKVAELSYLFAENKQIIIEHTEVDTSQAGKGLGKLLVKAAVDFATENNYKIVPVCSYAKNVFDKTPAYSEVLST